MPLYALDDDDKIISAADANEFRRYRCVECRSAMQKRAGKTRKPHFYHLQTISVCRLHSRSIDHQILQLMLSEKNPALTIERPFEKILRIADLCWEEQKIIFEIQCTLIEPHEARQRMLDYESEGYYLIWLLDDRLYNRKRLRIAENYLISQASYHLSLSKSIVYDQFEVIAKDNRLIRGPRLPVDLQRPRLLPGRHDEWTRQLQRRTGRYYFAGDLVDRVIIYPQYLSRLKEFETEILEQKAKKNGLTFLLKKWLYIALEFLLRSVAED